MADMMPTGHIWVTNVGRRDAADAILRTYQKADPDYDFVIGPPQRTYKYTQAELSARGAVAVYGKPRS